MSKETSWNWVVRKWDGEEWPEKRTSIATDDGHAIFISARYAGDVTEQASMAAAAPRMFNALANMLEHFAEVAGDCADKEQAAEEESVVMEAQKAILEASGQY